MHKRNCSLLFLLKVALCTKVDSKNRKDLSSSEDDDVEEGPPATARIEEDCRALDLSIRSQVEPPATGNTEVGSSPIDLTIGRQLEGLEIDKNCDKGTYIFTYEYHNCC